MTSVEKHTILLLSGEREKNKDELLNFVRARQERCNLELNQLKNVSSFLSLHPACYTEWVCPTALKVLLFSVNSKVEEILSFHLNEEDTRSREKYGCNLLNAESSISTHVHSDMIPMSTVQFLKSVIGDFLTDMKSASLHNDQCWVC